QLLEVERDPEDAAQAARARALGLVAGDPLEAFLLDEAQQVVDLVVLARDLPSESGIPLEERGRGGGELRLGSPRPPRQVLAKVFEERGCHVFAGADCARVGRAS